MHTRKRSARTLDATSHIASISVCVYILFIPVVSATQVITTFNVNLRINKLRAGGGGGVNPRDFVASYM